MKTVGDTLPPFKLRDRNGGAIQDSDLHGHWTVLHGYPNNMTLGCSQEVLA